MAVSEASGHGVEGREARPEQCEWQTSGTLLTVMRPEIPNGDPIKK